MKFQRFSFIFLLGILLFSFQSVYLYLTPHYTPQIATNLMPILEKSQLTSDDYALLYAQTGLSAPLIDELRLKPNATSEIIHYQDDFFRTVKVINRYLPPFTFCQLTVSDKKEPQKAFKLGPYHNGDILMTNSTHSLAWRHGHMGLIVDEIHGYSLEALSPGRTSCLQNIHKWEYYPTFKMLRLKNASWQQINTICEYALEHLAGLPYNIFSTKKQWPPTSTHCALLIWQAFMPFGYDLAPQSLVTPNAIVSSPYLELLQIYGFDPKKD